VADSTLLATIPAIGSNFGRMLQRSEARKSKIKTGLASEVFAFLNSAHISKRLIEFRKKQTLCTQGEPARHVFYIQEGSIKVAVTSAAGKEAVVALLGAGDFLGEGCLVGQPLWIATATAITHGRALVIEKSEMLRLLHADHEFSDRFISYMVTRNLRTEEDLIDQLFNSSEKRLARALLLLARYGKPSQALTLPRVSQTVLAEMVGTTRTRVNYFMNKFRKLGFIEYNGSLKINNSLLSVVLRD
jgi:CRP/FNR family transcriptional regulator, cyclic AMP receptor protein